MRGLTEDEEDYDELPPITVNSSGRDSSSFAMPCAVELAAQRAREERCERELARLRDQHSAGAGAGAGVAGVAHSDSSGSEGEAALAAAVTALRVRASARAAPPPPRLAALLPAAAPHLPAVAAAFLAEYARAAAGLPPPHADTIAARTLRRLEGWLQAEGGGGGDEAARAGCGAWLCLALAAAERARLGTAAARAAHCLLEECGPALVLVLAPALLAAVAAPRARLELADALRSGGERADALADELVRAALTDMLDIPPVLRVSSQEERDGGAVARWRRLPAPAQYTALQLAARARVCGGAGAEAGHLLATLATAAPPSRDHTPDALKVLVGASKMQVLFPVKK